MQRNKPAANPESREPNASSAHRLAALVWQLSQLWLAGPDIETCYIGQSCGMVFAEAVILIE
jgi:hypothetical protein